MLSMILCSVMFVNMADSGCAERTNGHVDLEARVRRDHPLRSIRLIANQALEILSKEFAALYAREGRPSIAPEKLLRAILLQAFYSVRSERQLMDRLEFDFLFRWFVGLGVDDPARDHSTFSKNRDRLLAGDIAAKFLAAVLDQPRVKRLLSNEHFSVDGTLIAACSISTLVSSPLYSGVPLWQRQRIVSSKKRYDSTPHLISNHTRSPPTSKLIAQYSVLHQFAVGACSRDDGSSVAKFHR
jgi:transposase